ncbi:MAG: DUF1203 domain-containing protein [Pseudomonadota bacterium]
MTFHILALPSSTFAPLFALDDDALAERNIRRQVVDSSPGYPCRVSLADAEIGETVLLLNHTYQSAASPYRAAHAIYVREGVAQAHPEPGEVPDVMSRRLLSLRAFDGGGMMRGADVVEGKQAGPSIARLLGDPQITEVHIHNAKPGCFAARAVRV